MFERLIEQLILRYLGEYIEDLDKDKLKLGIWSGSLTLENIKIKSKTVNDLKLPFKLILGRIDKINLIISWKSNFSSPTEIIVEGINIVLSLIKPKDWEYIDYISYESKLDQLMKYSNEKYVKLIESFNFIKEKNEGYTDRILLKIIDNLHVVLKKIHIRIEEPHKTPYYSAGITLKELFIINTNNKWDEQFIDRNIDKKATMYKLLKITDFGIYLQVNETNLISIDNDNELLYKKMNELFPENSNSAINVTYLVNPMSLVAKMKQLNIDSIIEEYNNKLKSENKNNNETSNEINDLVNINNMIKKEAIIKLEINLSKFEIEIKKEQYNCVFFILNTVTKYQKFQAAFFETRKFNFFKPNKKVLSKEKLGIITDKNVKNENAVLWWKFSIDMALKWINYYKGNKNAFDIPENTLKNYKEKYTDYFEKYFKGIKKSKNNAYKFEDDETAELFRKIIYSVDIKILYKWTKPIIEKIFKDEKVEEKKYQQQSYFSYFLGWGSNNNVDESKLFTPEELNKLEELFNKKDKELLNNEINVPRFDINLEFVLNEGLFRFMKCFQTDTAQMNEGFEIKYKNLQFSVFAQNKHKIYFAQSILDDFSVDLLTIVNKNVSHFPIAFRDFGKEKTKLSNCIKGEQEEILHIPLFIELNNSINNNEKNDDNNISNKKSTDEEEKKSKEDHSKNLIGNGENNENILEENKKKMNSFNYTFQLQAIYSPEKETNLYFWLHFTELNLTYHQVFIARALSFFKVEVDEELTNKAVKKMRVIKETTQTTLKNNMPKRNIIRIQIDPRNMIIPINKYDINNSKLCLLEIGLILMDTSQTQNNNNNTTLTINSNNQNIKSENNENKEINAKNEKNDQNEKNNNDNINLKYKNKYNIDINSFSLSYYPSLKEMLKNENRFDILTDVSAVLGFALLRSDEDNHKYSSIKCYASFNNVSINLTDYLYAILINVMDILKPTAEKDLWTQINTDKSEIAKNSKGTAVILKKNWINNSWDEYLGMISGGYIYFYNSFKDEEYSGYFYLKDSTIEKSIDLLILKVTNSYGSIELKFQNNKKLLQWERLILERVEEMKISETDKSEEIINETKKKKIDPLEIYCGGEILFKQFNISLYHNNNDTIMNKNNYVFNNITKLFEMKFSNFNILMNLREYDTYMNLEIQSLKIYDKMSSISAFSEMINSVNENDKETKLMTISITLSNEKSPDYKHIEMDIDLAIGYLYFIWNPLIIRKLLGFLIYNDAYKNKVLREIANPSEKLIEEKFIEPAKEVAIKNPNCKETNYIYMRVHTKLKNINIILIQPIMNIMYHEVQLGESFIDSDMTVDHVVIKGELRNVQIFDLCEYPFIIKSQKDYNPKNKREIFGINKSKNNNSLISFSYSSFNDDCPLMKNNYYSLCDVKIESPVLVYVQEQFLRLFNYFISEFLGSLGQELSEEEKNKKKLKEKNKFNERKTMQRFSIRNTFSNIGNYNNYKDERDIQFMKLNVILGNTLVILKPRIYFDNAFFIELEKMTINCFYNKANGKVRSDVIDWRWITTYKINLFNMTIKTSDNFDLCLPTNGEVNMHFTNNTTNDLLLSPLEFDFSYQFDVIFGKFVLNLRQQDYTNLMRCSDLNILYTDGKNHLFNYEIFYKKIKEISKNTSKFIVLNVDENDLLEKDKDKDESKNKKENNNNNNNNNDNDDDDKYENKFTEKEKEKMMAEFANMVISLYMPQIELHLFLENNIEIPFSKLILKDMILFFDTKLNGSCVMNCYMVDIEIFHVNNDNTEDVIVSDFKQMVINETIENNGIFQSSIFDSMFSGDNRNNNNNNSLKNDDFAYTRKTISRISENYLEKNKLKKFNESNDKNLGIKLFGFGKKFYNLLKKCQLINHKIVDNLNKIQIKIDMTIEPDRTKIYKVNLYYIKCFIRLDTIYLIQTFFLDGFPFYNPDAKDLPNLYDSNEENSPGYKMYITLLHPLICFLSDNVSNLEQEMYCISSEIKVTLIKEKIIEVKRKILDLENVINQNKKLTISSNNNSNNNNYDDDENNCYIDYPELKLDIWKFVTEINEISPFICTLNEVLYNEELFISNRKIMNNFNFIYSSKSELSYENNVFTIQNTVSIKTNQLTVNISFRDIMLLLGVINTNNEFLGDTYLQNYQSLLFYSTQKNKYEKEQLALRLKAINNEKKLKEKAKKLHIENEDEINTNQTIYEEENEQDEENENINDIDTTKNSDSSVYLYKFDGINLFVIDNQDNSYLPFVNLRINKLELKMVYYNNKNKKTNIDFIIKFYALSYNYIAGLWEPLIELSEIKFINETETDINKIVSSKYIVESSEKYPININISDLTLIFLYSVYNRWSTDYYRIKNSKEEKLIFNKKIKVSNHTIFNYTGQVITIFENCQDNSIQASMKSSVSSIKKSLISTIKINELNENEEKSKIIAEIEPNCSYNLEYPYHDKFNNNFFEQSFKNEFKIFFKLDNYTINDNEIEIDKVHTKKHPLVYNSNDSNNSNNNISNNKNLKKYSFVVSKVQLSGKKKFIFIFSPLSFQNKTNYKIKIILTNNKNKDNNDNKNSEDDNSLPDIHTTIEPNQIFGIPFDYLNGYIKIYIDNEFSKIIYKFELINFFTSKEINKQLNFNEKIYINLYHPVSDRIKNKIIKLRTCYYIINYLPFDLTLFFLLDNKNTFSKPFKLLKGESLSCDMINGSYDVNAKLSLLNGYYQSEGKYVTLYKINKDKNKNKDNDNNYYFTNIDLYDKHERLIDIMCSIIKKGKITIILSPYAVLINHASNNLNFYYGKKHHFHHIELNDEVSGKLDVGNIFLLKNKTKNMHVTYEEYISDYFISDVPGTSNTIICKKYKDSDNNDKNDKNNTNNNSNENGKKGEKQVNFIEFSMENNLYLLNKNYDLYCSVIEFQPKYIIWNKLTDANIHLSYENKKEENIFIELVPNRKEIFLFFGYGSDIKINIRILKHKERADIYQHLLPIKLLNNNTLTTIVLYNKSKTKKIYLNIELIENRITKYFIFKEAKIETAKIFILNQSKNLSIKMSQESYEDEGLYINPRSKSIFALENPNDKFVITFNFGLGKLDNRPLMISHTNKYEVINYNVLVHKFNCKNKEDDKYQTKFPYVEVINLEGDNIYKKHLFKLTINTDGIKFKFKFEDLIKDDSLVTSKQKEALNTVNTFILKIPEIGISLITDNYFIDCKKNLKNYQRNEICYISVKNLIFFNIINCFNNIINNNLQLKIHDFEIDNEISYLTNYPITLNSIIDDEKNNNELNNKNKNNLNNNNNNNSNSDSNKEDENIPPFFNLSIDIEENKNENTKLITLFNYLIQAFNLKIESNIFNGFFRFAKNITLGLETSITEVHPIFQPLQQNIDNKIVIKDNYICPIWKQTDNIERQSNIFIQTMEASSIEIKLSFLNQSKDNLFDNLLENKPFLSKLLSLLLNVENTSLNLEGFISNNISGEMSEILTTILTIYREKAINQLLKLFGSIEIIGNPLNLVRSIGTGIIDLFEQPAKGIVKGPLEGIKGIGKGGYSFIKNTIGGSFNTACKLTSGFSRGILLISQDEDYIIKREKKKMTEKPKNFVEGLGYGFTSLAGGIFYRITDIVRKPYEGAKKEKAKGFAKGLIKGLGGVITKPISGTLDLISKTSEGLINTLMPEEIIIQERIPRAFYGKMKYYKSFDINDSQVLYFIHKKLEFFRTNYIPFNSAIIYENKGGDDILLLFGTYTAFLIDYKRYEIKAELHYKNIKSIEIEKDIKIKISFNTKINNKNESSIKPSKNCKCVEKIFIMFQDALNEYKLTS